jgi:hypothetical protein
MNTKSVRFEINDREVIVHGIPELEGLTGGLIGDGVASFYKKEERKWYLANTETGRWRMMKEGWSLVLDDSEIDFEAVKVQCKHGLYNAERRLICYSDVSLYDNKFQNGYSGIEWMIYPEGQYFADSDGFGGEDCSEELLGAIIDKNLDFVEPFKPVKGISALLRQYREGKKEERHESCSTPSVYNKLPDFKPVVQNYILLDESASMSNIADEVLDRLHTVLQSINDEQIENPDKEYQVTIIKFNEYRYYWCDSVQIAEMPKFTKEDYHPSGGTALADITNDFYCCYTTYYNPDNSRLYIITDGYDTVANLTGEPDDIMSIIERLNKHVCQVTLIKIPNEYIEEELKYFYDLFEDWDSFEYWGLNEDKIP